MCVSEVNSGSGIHLLSANHTHFNNSEGLQAAGTFISEISCSTVVSMHFDA